MSVLSLQGLRGGGGRGECFISHLFRSRITFEELCVKLCTVVYFKCQKVTRAVREITTSGVKSVLVRVRVRVRRPAGRPDSTNAVLVHARARARVIYRCLEL